MDRRTVQRLRTVRRLLAEVHPNDLTAAGLDPGLRTAFEKVGNLPTPDAPVGTRPECAYCDDPATIQIAWLDTDGQPDVINNACDDHRKQVNRNTEGKGRTD